MPRRAGNSTRFRHLRLPSPRTVPSQKRAIRTFHDWDWPSALASDNSRLKLVVRASMIII
jgi:hypothetical protein